MLSVHYFVLLISLCRMKYRKWLELRESFIACVPKIPLLVCYPISGNCNSFWARLLMGRVGIVQWNTITRMCVLRNTAAIYRVSLVVWLNRVQFRRLRLPVQPLHLPVAEWTNGVMLTSGSCTRVTYVWTSYCKQFRFEVGHPGLSCVVKELPKLSPRIQLHNHMRFFSRNNIFIRNKNQVYSAESHAYQYFLVTMENAGAVSEEVFYGLRLSIWLRYL